MGAEHGGADDDKARGQQDPVKALYQREGRGGVVRGLFACRPSEPAGNPSITGETVAVIAISSVNTAPHLSRS